MWHCNPWRKQLEIRVLPMVPSFLMLVELLVVCSISGINKNSTSIIFLIRTVQFRRYCKEEFEQYKINNQKHVDIAQ